MRFAYTAVDNNNKEMKGVVEADNNSAAINQIRDLGLFPTNVMAEKAAGKKGAGAGAAKAKGKGMSLEISFLSSGKVKNKILVVFTRQLAVLIDAGLPLMRSLKTLERQQKAGPLKTAITGIADSVESGSTFSEALANFPKIFTRLFVNMVKAGEAGGQLELVLNQLAEFMEKAEKLKAKVKAAMIYPIAVICVAVGVLSYLMISVVPKFKDIFSDFDTELPQMTTVLINTSNWIKSNVYYDHPPYVGMLIMIPVGIVIVLKILAKTDMGKFYIDSGKLNAPLFGQLVRKVSIARFARTLGTLINSGVPILQALNIVRETSGNEVISKAVGSVHDSIREGESICTPLRETKVFTPMVISMIEVGEETGKLPDMLIRIANNYDDEVDVAVEGLTSVIEPILIVFLAVMVGFIVIALFLPLIKLIQTVSG